MKVYQLHNQDGYHRLRESSTDDMEIIDGLRGLPVSQNWAPPTVTLARESDFFEGTIPSDYPHLSPGVPVFSVKAAEALRDILEMHGELLPLISEDCEGRDYLAFNVTTVVDALDVPRSDVKYFRDGVRVMHVNRYAFIPERLAGVSIFKLPYFVKGRVYVTDSFVQQVLDLGLTGFKFTPLWSNE